MQKKIPRASRFSDRLNRWALRRGFPFLLFVAPRLPRGLIRPLGRWIIAVVFFFHYRPKRLIRANLARILGEPAGSRRVRAATRQMLDNFSCYWADLFRFAQLPPERAMALVDRIEGREHLDAAIERGKGVLLLTAHLGNWELGGVFLQWLRVPLSVVYVPDEFEDVERFRQQLRALTGVGEIAIRPDEMFTSLPVLRALRENRVVALQGDRDFNDRGAREEFLGAPVSFPLGPFMLALLTGATLLPTFIAYTAGQRFELVIGEPLRVESTGDRAADLRRGLRAWLGVLEAAVRRWPTQWYTFYDFWGVAAAPAAPAAPAEGPATELRPTASGSGE